MISTVHSGNWRFLFEKTVNEPKTLGTTGIENKSIVNSSSDAQNRLCEMNCERTLGIFVPGERQLAKTFLMMQ